MLIPDEFGPDDLFYLMMHHGIGAGLHPMASAPTDGSHVVVVTVEFEGQRAEIRGTRSRVVSDWVTNEFIPSWIGSDDGEGMNHGALQRPIGWLPLPREWPVVGDKRC